MKALKSLALAGLLMIHAVTPSHGLVINNDPGGVIVDFVKKYSDICDRGEKVVVDGECDSSCTIFLGILPKQSYCATPNALLGFHTASTREKLPDGSFKVRARRRVLGADVESVPRQGPPSAEADRLEWG